MGPSEHATLRRRRLSGASASQSVEASFVDLMFARNDGLSTSLWHFIDVRRKTVLSNVRDRRYVCPPREDCEQALKPRRNGL